MFALHPTPCRGAHCAPAIEDGNKRFAPRQRSMLLLRCRLRRRGTVKTVPYKVGGTYRTKATFGAMCSPRPHPL
ncbi:MAG: hypothetical protein IJW62_08175 [Clostridia bacterium]|nr:hypothetical protein [Clostridia bacterium]